MDEMGAFFGGPLVGIGLLILGCLIQRESTERARDAAWRHDAVIAGHAEYVPLPDGDSRWQWKAVKP